MKTRNGVYHNILESDYVMTVGYIKFYFSSELYLTKFMDRYRDEIERFNDSINRMYKDRFDLDMTAFALVRLYTLIEKRGFYIKLHNREVITCLDDLRLGSVVEKNQSYND